MKFNKYLMLGLVLMGTLAPLANVDAASHNGNKVSVVKHATKKHSAKAKPAADEGKVTVHYVDNINYKPIADDDVFTGEVGTDYSVSAKDIAGYTSNGVSGTPKGKYTTDDIEVTFVYFKKSNPDVGSVITKYVDDEGNKIADSVTKNGNVGDPYTTDQKDIAGYTFKEVQGNATGTYTAADQVVTYVYTKDPVTTGNVIVDYVDEDGNPIADEIKLTGNVGETYTSEQKDIAGYTFKEVKGNATGTFTAEDQAVIYVYTKK